VTDADEVLGGGSRDDQRGQVVRGRRGGVGRRACGPPIGGAIRAGQRADPDRPEASRFGCSGGLSWNGSPRGN